MTQKIVARIIEDECVQIDGYTFLPPVPVRDGAEWWFQVFYDKNEIYSVQGVRAGTESNGWAEWLMDLRDTCSLGHTES